ncbi:MAG TPA: CinA family protein [Rhizomicrobium sp.]|jgi:nicotinamide-nucleotide amidase|nr:CinA family protein [Rhizomicrobium sp.]
MFSAEQIHLAEEVFKRARVKGLRVATAESCTGGLVAALLTEIPGSSEVFERGFVTYSNQAKMEMLGVSAKLLAEFGTVSEPVARRMAEGALERSAVQLAVAVTGIAGPGGGSASKPVGLVHIAAAREGRTLHEEHRFGDIGRSAIRLASVEAALLLLLRLL